jgi:hypothetical protein
MQAWAIRTNIFFTFINDSLKLRLLCLTFQGRALNFETAVKENQPGAWSGSLTLMYRVFKECHVHQLSLGFI